ncbi:Cystatin-C [Fukomys damarensis]|uniref:Cystatin-C n=1 Tax=Fukomys damarensis TaxID=885580 RepID=A0A091CUW4_FUKDA|nr:Cystatin-C [Fukomys damarensis]
MTSILLRISAERTHEGALLIGGLEDLDFNRKGVQQAVDFALQEYNNENNDLNVSRLVRVVVAGMNYYLDLEIGGTTCAKSQSEQPDCPFSVDPV